MTKEINITDYKVSEIGLHFKANWQEYFYSKETIAQTWETYGWSFAKALAIALYRADHLNTKRILETWEFMVKEFIIWFLLDKQK